MSCDDAGLLLHAYVDNELDLVHSLEIEKHLENCETCALAVKNHRTLSAAMRDASLYYQTPRERKLLPPAPNRYKTYSIIALAASLLIGAFLAGRLQPRQSVTEQEILDSHLRSLMPGHLADVQSTDQHTVKPWFNGKLNFSPPVSDFVQQGFPLTGGRIDSIGGREVAVLIYRRSQHVINVYLWESPGSSDSRFDKSTDQGYNVIHWDRAGLHCWIISDLNANELADFAGLLRAAMP